MDIVNIVLSGCLESQIKTINGYPIIRKTTFIKKTNNSGIIITIDNTKISLYKSGKYIIVGVKSFEEIDTILNKFFNILEINTNINSLKKPKIVNLVTVDHMHHSIDLLLLYQKLSNGILDSISVEYEPEQFSGLICRFEEGTVMVFSTGRVSFMGFKDINDAKYRFNQISSITN